MMILNRVWPAVCQACGYRARELDQVYNQVYNRVDRLDTDTAFWLRYGFPGKIQVLGHDSDECLCVCGSGLS